jgi:tetratricopeptide (TPR) repeat protein
MVTIERVPRRFSLVTVAALIVVSGCAAHGKRLESRFVKPGEPKVKLDAEVTPEPPSLQDFMRKVRTLQAKAHPKSSLLPTIETSDPQLAKALLLLAMHEDAQTHRVVASAYRDAGVLDYAFRHYQRAAVLESCDAVAYDGMARIWRDWGSLDIALSEAYRGLHCNPKSADLQNTLGTVLQGLGDTSGAAMAYARAVALNPRAAFALNNLCYLDLERGRTESAARYCESALTADPTFEVARNNLALAQAILGDVRGAEERLLAAGSSASAQYNVGMLRLATGRYPEAAEAFDRAADEKPSFAIARRRAVQARRAALGVEPQ